MHVPDSSSKEGKLMEVLKNPVDWLGLGEPTTAGG